jgi:hypothetical protein
MNKAKLVTPEKSTGDVKENRVPRMRERMAGLIGTGVLLLVAGLLPSAQAQSTMTIKPFQIRVEVPTGFNSTYYITNCNLRIPTNGASGVDGTGTNWIIPDVNVSISGAPAGCTASLVASDLVTPVSTIPVAMNTGNTAKNTNLVVKLSFDGTEASGVSTVTIDATGAGLPDDPFLLPLEVAKIWNGPANASAGAGTWSDGSQWLGTGAPGPNDHVVFTDLGTQTNNLLTTATTTNLLTSTLITADTTISALRFSQTNGLGNPKTNWHNLYINPNVTLAVAGNDGFSMLRDYPYWNQGLMKVSIYGTNGSFVQTNVNSTFSILSDAQQMSVLDMSGLGNLRLDVNQLHLSDYLGYPNYFDLAYTNNYSNTSTAQGKPQRFYQTWNLAGTNFIRATYVDPYNYTNAESRSYALELGRNEASGGGSGKDVEVFMGRSNVFNLDSMCVAGSFCLGADFQFLNTNSYAIFRNSDGVSRMSIFATADAGGPTLEGTTLGDNTKCGGGGLGVDFTKGTVDMLVDRLYLSMDRSNVTANGKGVSQTSGFFFTAGIIDANTAIFGYQNCGSQTNQSYCYAQVTVSNTAVLKVNDTLALGYTTSSNGDVDLAYNGYGRLTIGPGGTVEANKITVGGISKLSRQNTITLNDGASLIVSNTIADATPGGALGTLSLNGNASLTLFVNGTNPPAALVYVTNLTASGVGNKLIIGDVQNVASYPVDIPLIAGAGPALTASVFDGGVQMPSGSGLTGVLFLSSSNTINIHIINRAPNSLLWRGPGDTANWDYTSKYWLDVNTGMMTNYNDPDVVSFDDTPGFATNINITGATALTPGGINMTNNTLHYALLDGGNSIVGSAALNKYGTGPVEVDANTTLGVQLNEGSFTGVSGSVGSVNAAAGTVMNYGGTIGGSLICAGNATIAGTINGTMTVQSGGVVTNSGTVKNPFSVQTNGYLYNAGSGALHNIGVGTVGSPQVASGGILINAGAIGEAAKGDVLFVNGTFEDLATSGMMLSSLTMGAGGTFIPGGDGIGTTTINSDGTGSFPGAALLQQGSTTIFKVNPAANPSNTGLTSAHLSFGGSSSARNQNGCTLVVTNIGVTPFSAGQSFQLFANIFNSPIIFSSTGSSTNTYPVVVPPPGPGLAWDLRPLWVNGSIAVVAVNSGPKLTNSFGFDSTGTNFVGQFSWDSSYYGYRLETLVVPPSVGLSPNTNYNWSGIPGSWTNTSVNVTNTIGTNDVFFRLVFP